MAENEQFFRIVVDYQSGLDALKKVEDALKDVKDRQKELIDEMKKGNTSQEEYGTKMQDLTVKIKLYTDQRRQAIKIAKTITELNNAEEGSLVRLSAEYGRLYDVYRNMSREDRNGKQGQILIQQLNEINNELATSEAAVGRYSRNVGNYASGFSPLNFQVQQLARELPSLTVSTQQFFLAISNNLPMLVDEMQRARVANEALKKAGETTVPVWKQMLKSIGSWQTMLVVGITLLTAYGKEIGQFFKMVFNGTGLLKSTAEIQQDVTKKMADNTSSVGDQIAVYKKLQDQWRDMKGDAEEQKKWIKTNKTEFDNLGVSINNIADADSLFISNSGLFIEALKLRARSLAAFDLAKEKYAEAVKKEIELQGAQDQAWDDTVNRVKAEKDSWLFGGNQSLSPVQIVQPMQFLSPQFKEAKSVAKVKQIKNETQALYALGDAYLDLSNSEDEAYKTQIKGMGLELSGTESRSSGKTENAYKKIAFEELKAAQELALSEQNYAAKMNEAILNDENQSYENRMAALEQFTSNKQNVILQGADDEIENLIRSKAKELNIDADNKNDRVKIEKICANQIGVIRDEANTKVLELEETKNKKQQAFAEKKIQQDLDTQKFQVSLMEDGTAKQLALLEIEHAEKLMKAKKNGTDLLEIDKWYKKEQEKILAASPHGERIKADAQAAANYHKEIARIESLKIKEEEKDYLKEKAENDLEKTKILNHKAEIDRLYSLGKITVDEYNKMSAEIGVDLANNENKGNELDDPKNPKLKKVGRFFSKLFGYDPDDKDDRKEFKQKRKELIDQAADTAREIGQAVIDIQTEISQRRLKLEQERIDAERDSELKSLELRYNKGLMSEKAYNKAVEATNAEADRKKEEAERAAFEREKRLKIMGIAIDTAAGITKVWSEVGLSTFKLGWAIAQTAFLTASGIAQTAVISNQQFAKGGIVPIGDGKNGVSMGMLQGPSHSQGGIPLMVNGQPVNAEVEGGEILAVINKRSAAQYLPLFSAINATNGVKFENGGVIGSGWSLPTPAPLPPSNGQLIAQLNASIQAMRIDFNNGIARSTKATLERVDNIKVHVVEKDITKTQKKVASIRAKATIIGG